MGLLGSASQFDDLIGNLFLPQLPRQGRKVVQRLGNIRPGCDHRAGARLVFGRERQRYRLEDLGEDVLFGKLSANCPAGWLISGGSLIRMSGKR